MTISELRDYLARYVGEGKGDTRVAYANKSWNPVTESEDITNALFIEDKNGNCVIVLQTE